jgi:hypothetical protein
MKIAKRERIKISDNFYLDEFIHPEIYKRFGKNSTVYLNQKLIEIVELLRKGFNEERNMIFKSPKVGFVINNWGTGGKFINSGVRDFFNPHKKGSRSRHYYGLCADLKLTGGIDEKELYLHILKYKEFYFEKGLTTIENYNFTPGWVHVSIEWRPNEEEIRIINP